MTVYTDGGSRGNPGKSACGIVIFDMNDKLFKMDGMYLGVKTNNQAEYLGLIEALKMMQTISCDYVKCYLDSELIVKQLTGVYKIKNENIKKYKHTIDQLVQKFKKIEYLHIRREKNTFADKLVNIVLDAVEKEHQV